MKQFYTATRKNSSSGSSAGTVLRMLPAVLFAFFLVCLVQQPPASAETAVPLAGCVRTAGEIALLTDGKKEDAFFPGLTMNGTEAIYDQEDSAFYFSLPQESSLQQAAFSVRTGDMYILDQADDAGQPYDIIFVSDSSFFRAKLVLTSLPVMNICGITREAEEGYVPARIAFHDNRGEKTVVTETAAQIKVRGGTSRKYPKKGYKIQLVKENGSKNSANLLGLRKDDDWILYAAYNDPEKIRNVFSSNLWYDSCAGNNPYGIRAGMEYRFIELFQDSRYWGLYALGYPVDDKQFRHGTEGFRGLLKKASSHEIPEKDVEISSDPLPGYEIKTDGCDEAALWHTLREIYHAADTASSPSEVWQYIDRENAVDLFLFVNFTQAVDNYSGGSMRNMYYAIMENGRLLYIPWDLDQTFGTLWYGSEVQNYTLAYAKSPDFNLIMKINPVYRFRKNKTVKKNIRERYRFLREHEWSEDSLLARIDAYEQQIFLSGAYEREQERWPEGTYPDEETGLSLFREFVRKRLAAMDAYISGL